MPSSLQNTFSLAAACCDALERATTYRDAQHITQETVDPKFRQIDSDGPRDQLWKEIQYLYGCCRNEPKQFTQPEDFSVWRANLYRFAQTALSVRTLLTTWAGIDLLKSQKNIQPKNLLETRVPEKNDFPKVSQSSDLETIGNRTFGRLRSRGITPFPPWTYEKYRRHFLFDTLAHKRIMHLCDLPEQVCGFYSWEIEKSTSAARLRPEKRDLGGKELETLYTPEAEIVLRRIGFDEVDYRRDTGASPVHALIKEVVLKIACCLLRDSTNEELPLRLPG